MSRTMGICSLFLLISTAACGNSPRLFITSRDYQGDFAKGATAESLGDEQCRTAATSGGLGGERWIAWLATSAGLPNKRVTGEGPWVDVKGELIFKNRGGLEGGTPTVGVKWDEQGRDVSGDVWTGVRTNNSLGSNCADWTKLEETNMGGTMMLRGTVGSANVTNGTWTEKGEVPCSSRARLLCLEGG